MNSSRQKRVRSLRSTYLIAQARYTIGMAKADPVVAKAAGSKVLSELESDLQALESQVLAWRQSRQQTKALTLQERDIAEGAARWIVAFRKLYRVATTRGEALPALPPGPPSTTRNTTKLAVEVGSLLKSGKEYAAALAAVGAGLEFTARGEKIMTDLLAADQKQEISRSEGRAAERHKLLALKLRVWTGVQAVVTMGRSVYAGDPIKSAPYRMRILYRGLAEVVRESASPPETPVKEAS